VRRELQEQRRRKKKQGSRDWRIVKTMRKKIQDNSYLRMILITFQIALIVE
jgi:hypothetical protein